MNSFSSPPLCSFQAKDQDNDILWHIILFVTERYTKVNIPLFKRMYFILISIYAGELLCYSHKIVHIIISDSINPILQQCTLKCWCTCSWKSRKSLEFDYIPLPRVWVKPIYMMGITSMVWILSTSLWVNQIHMTQIVA